MSKNDIYIFVSKQEFEMLCEDRIDAVISQLLQITTQLRADEPDYDSSINTLKNAMLGITRVQIDMEDVVRKKGAK